MKSILENPSTPFRCWNIGLRIWELELHASDSRCLDAEGIGILDLWTDSMSHVG